MRKRFVAPVLREEATLSKLTLQSQACSGNTCDAIFDGIGG
jgi:hypothetical protein